MFSYIINRWSVARRFEKVEDGYIYRRRPDLPGIKVTEEERQDTLHEFRGRYWRWWLFFLAGSVAAVVAIAIVSAALDPDKKFVTFAGYSLAIVMFILVLKEQRRWSALPEERFADRPRVPSDFDAGGWFARYRSRSRQRSWLIHTALIAIYGAISWLLAPQSLDASVERWFLFACFAVGLVLLIYGAFVKVREPNR